MLASLGLGCYLGWQTIDISPTLFPEPRPGVNETLDVWGYVATTLLLLLLVVFALLSHRTGSLLRRPWIVAAASLGPALGTALLYLSGWVAGTPFMPGVIAGRLLFAASAGFVVLWGEVLTRIPASHMLACVAGGYAASFGICLLEANLTATAALAFRPVLPLLSGAMLLALQWELSLLPEQKSYAEIQPGQGVHLPIRLFVGTGILGAIFIATNHLSETKTAISTELYTLIAGIAVTLALLALALPSRRRHGNFALLYRLITPLVIGCLLLTLVLEPGSQHYEALAIGGAWAFFRVFTWTFWARVGARSTERGAYVFALGQIALTACSTASELLCTAVNLASVPLVGAASVIIFATVITSALVMDEGWLSRRSETDALANPDDSAVDPFSPADPNDMSEVPESTAANALFDLACVTSVELSEATRGLGLSERERDIALHVLHGLDNGTICQTACITESTLRTHLRNMYSKLDVHSRAELIDLLEGRLRG